MDEPQRKPTYPSWNYSFGEIVADGAVHATGVVLGLVGSVLLVLWAAGSAGTVELAAVFVYVAALLAGVWATALVGAALKLAFPGRLDRLSIALYLALGWSVVAVYDSVLPALPSSALVLLALGGLLYSGGVIFHVWSRLRFQNAIWHAFVLAAAACHWGAIVDCIVLARA